MGIRAGLWLGVEHPSATNPQGEGLKMRSSCTAITRVYANTQILQVTTIWAPQRRDLGVWVGKTSFEETHLRNDRDGSLTWPRGAPLRPLTQPLQSQGLHNYRRFRPPPWGSPLLPCVSSWPGWCRRTCWRPADSATAGPVCISTGWAL